MVEYGLARFKKSNVDGSRCTETDEPLAILGIVKFLSTLGHTLERHEIDPLNSPIASTTGLAFESFCAYLLARAFATPTPLSNVFTFSGHCSLGKEKAELVALRKGRTGFVYHNN
jgi:hypothetical protein